MKVLVLFRYLLRGVSPVEDGDYSETRVRDLYNADLANNPGNLVRRIETLGDKAGYVLPPGDIMPEAPDGFHEALSDFRFHDAVTALWGIAASLNQYIDQVKPWELQKQNKTQAIYTFLDEVVRELRRLSYWLEPFLPETSKTIQVRFTGGKPLAQGEPLFPRLP